MRFLKIEQKVIFICEDFNIYLLNPKKHKMTNDFIDTMYGMSLYPKYSPKYKCVTKEEIII